MDFAITFSKNPGLIPFLSSSSNSKMLYSFGGTKVQDIISYIHIPNENISTYILYNVKKTLKTLLIMPFQIAAPAHDEEVPRGQCDRAMQSFLQILLDLSEHLYQDQQF